MKKVLLVLGLVVVALLAVVATRPDAYHVERSIDVAAVPANVFPAVGDLKGWGEWSPWEKRDPAMRKTFSDTTTGVGASYAWEGNKQVGKGKMTITESRPNEFLAQKLEFIEPFPSVANIAIDLKPAGDKATKVTWSMDGKSNFVGKAFSLVMNMDKVVGKDFEEGLANLKRISEAKQAAADAAAAAPPAPAAAVAVPPAPPAVPKKR